MIASRARGYVYVAIPRTRPHQKSTPGPAPERMIMAIEINGEIVEIDSEMLNELLRRWSRRFAGLETEEE